MHPDHADVKLATLQEYGDAMGLQKLRALLSSYSCPLNKEVESFLKDESRAVHSSKMSSSVTYLARDLATGDRLGYFTLMMKAYSVKAAELTSANRRLVKRSSEIDAAGNLTTAVYLIAQIGKNYALPEERRISGAVLLELALMVFRRTKEAIGGKLVMVEREIDRPKLLDFYNDNGFKSWTTRRNARDGMVYDQMFSVLDNA
jgi:hypothetical protein